MIGHRVDIEEQRSLAAFPSNQIDCAVVVKTVGFEVARAEIAHIQIMRDAGRRLKSARSEKRTVERIHAEGLIAAVLQRARQPAIDATGSDPRHGCRKPPERANRKAGEHIVFGEPAWSADALHEKLARLAIERLKMSMIPGRHIDPGRHGDVKARFIVQQDDMWKLARWMAAGVGSLRHCTHSHSRPHRDIRERTVREPPLPPSAQISRRSFGLRNPR